ncbi:hypothetical protein ASPCAL10237 [Aspergillus calidoustus]|uniref:Uncharacterized protein n=1 Tax=Aspergillus calidoustus TaxID=454130 RepID=A0A0U5G5Q3_ASPCI|nr:hypothetical protein ASPCAL10237 [Aspergillus calidoustus]
MSFSVSTSPFPLGGESSPVNMCTSGCHRQACDLLVNCRVFMSRHGANDTGAPTAKLVHLSGQRAQIHASEQSASQEDTLSEPETLVPDDASLRSAEHGGEWRQAGTAAGRDAVWHTTSQRHISRGRTSLNTAGHRTLRVLAHPQSSALVAALYNAEHRHSVRHSALVLGPYGRPPVLARFGIVLLIVEDIGIARVFSLIQTLVLASEQHRAMVRKLIVVWQMEDLDNRRWVNMQHLLDLDRQEFKILRFVLYYRRNRKNEPSRNPGTRVRFMKGSVDVPQTITTYLKTRRGSMLVGVCARQSIRNQVKAIVEPNLSEDLLLLDLNVEPCHQWSNTDTTVADTTGPSRKHVQWIPSRIAEGRGHSG